MIVKQFFVLILFCTGVELQKNDYYTIGCVKCRKTDSNKINVHLIPHSHDDVGWLKTFDEYYYGLNQSTQMANVHTIISSVVEALSLKSDRKYIQVETAYFYKWWEDQSDEMRSKFKALVDNGQIEMVNGAWSMNDEACTNYQSTIDQFTWGLRLIEDTVGSCGRPRVGWQIDAFGHSREQASLFAQFGFDGVFFARLDHDDKKTRQKGADLDFAWQGSANIGHTTIFGGAFPTTIYDSPESFCWDFTCIDDTLVDNPNSPNYNIDSRAKDFKNLINKYKTYVKSNNVLITMGGDFHYGSAEANFINMDKLIKAFSNDTDLNVFYSTPSCYIKEVQNAKAKLLLKTDDFFPYSDGPHSFWAGYFTSRPNLKRFERVGHGILQATKQLYGAVTYNTTDNYNNDLKDLREAMGIIQHHDAITGTEQQHVANDYVRMLTQAIETAEKPAGTVIRKLLEDENDNITLELSSCLLSNISICGASQQSYQFVVVVHNPLAWSITHYVRLPVENGEFEIIGPEGAINFAVVPTAFNFSHVELNNQIPSSYELVFESHLPPMGFNTYYINKTTTVTTTISPISSPTTTTPGTTNSTATTPATTNYTASIPTTTTPATTNSTTTNSVDNKPGISKAMVSLEYVNEVFNFGGSKSGFSIDNETNLLKAVTIDGVSANVTQYFAYYDSAADENVTQIRSGAYIFRPQGTSPTIINNRAEKLSSTQTALFEEFCQKFPNELVDIVQCIRAYKNAAYIEFDWLVGDINIGDNATGKEIVSIFAVQDNFSNQNVFYTDSNGRERIKRQLSHRPDYVYDPKAEPIASNYYPITSAISLRDEKKKLEFTILNDRSQGGASIQNGQVELMIHRRLFKDDNKGVAEALNETEFNTGVYVRGSHYLLFGSISQTVTSSGNLSTIMARQRILAQQKLTQPWVLVAPASNSYEELENIVNKSYSLLSEELPENVNIITFEPWKDESFILRLEHIFEKDDDPTLSEVAFVKLTDMFNKFKIKEITEYTLAANEKLDVYKQRRYNWTTQNEAMDIVIPPNDKSALEIYLSPMQIRTFIIKFDDTAPTPPPSTHPPSTHPTPTPDPNSAVITQPWCALFAMLIAIILQTVVN